MPEQKQNTIDPERVVSRDPEVHTGAPVFAGTRVPVDTRIDYLRGGHSIDDFLVGFPGVERWQVEAFEMATDVQPVHEHVLSLLAPSTATAVLDLGCGRGEHLRMLAQQVPARVRLVGIDSSEKSIEAARTAVGGEPRFELLTHDLGQGIPFPDGTFDRVLCVNVIEAIPDRNALLRQIHRVLDPSGLLVMAHFDWDSQLYDGVDKALVCKVVRSFADWKQKWMADADGWMGRRLRRTCQRSGLFEGRVDAFVHTSTSFAPGHYGWERSQDFSSMVKRELITLGEYQQFSQAQQELAARDEYFYAITMFSYVGRKRDSARA